MLTAGYTVKAISDSMGMSMQALNTVFNVADVKSGFLERLSNVLGIKMSFFYVDGSPSAATPDTIAKNNIQGNNNSHNTQIAGTTDTAQLALKDQEIALLRQERDFLKEQIEFYKTKH